MQTDPPNPRWFKVAYAGDDNPIGEMLAELKCPLFVPWDFLTEHEAQVVNNHHMNLKGLNDRGGLQPSEMVAILNHRTYHVMTSEDSVGQLIALLAAWNESHGS